MEKYDVIVIGAGPGGYPAAIRAAQLGARVALVEREWLGGTCLNCGCIPTKAMIAGAELFRSVRQAGEMGVKVGEPEVDYPAMNARKREVVSTLQQGVAGLLKANKVSVYEGRAAFESRRQIKVSGEGEDVRLRAGRVIIATGSTSAMPGFLPDDPRIVDSRRFLELEELPERLLVLGGGYIGCELACLAAALGVKVTVVEMLEEVLMLLDRDARGEVSKAMHGELGIELMCGSPLEDVKVEGGVVRGRAGEQALEADMLLVAVGRRPVTDGLNLAAAGLDTDDDGYLRVDGHSRTGVPGIYAVGDVSGRVQLAHAATQQGIAAAEDAMGMPAEAETLIPGVIFTMPEVAVVGVTEQQAREEGLAVEKAKFHFRALGKALASGESAGWAKWLADRESGALVGACVVGARATDLIAEATLAIRSESTAAEVGGTVHGHPTFGEVWMEAAHALEGQAIHAPPRRR